MWLIVRGIVIVTINTSFIVCKSYLQHINFVHLDNNDDDDGDDDDDDDDDNRKYDVDDDVMIISVLHKCIPATYIRWILQKYINHISQSENHINYTLFWKPCSCQNHVCPTWMKEKSTV